MLLNILQLPDGTIDEETHWILKEMASWISVCGEGVYGTRPWRVFGETYKDFVPTEVFAENAYNKLPREIIPDFRFTSKGKNVYIIVRGIEDQNFTVTSFKPTDKVAKVSLLGSGKKINWKQNAGGLDISVPAPDPKKVPVYVLKAELK